MTLYKLTITTTTTEVNETSVEIFYNAIDASEFAQREIKDFISTYGTEEDAEYTLEGLEPYAEVGDNSISCAIEHFEPKGKQEFFPAFSIMKDDLLSAEGLSKKEKKEIEELPESAMRWIASKMGDHICEYYDWADDLMETYGYYKERFKN